MYDFTDSSDARKLIEHGAHGHFITEDDKTHARMTHRRNVSAANGGFGTVIAAHTINGDGEPARACTANRHPNLTDAFRFANGIAQGRAIRHEDNELRACDNSNVAS